MRSVKFIKLLILVITILTVQGTVKGSIPYKLDSNNSKMEITGTSTLHDWEMEVIGFTGTLNLQDENSIDKPVSGSLSINVNSITCDEKLMRKKTYEALNESSYPIIEVKLINAENGKAQVELKIAGVTQTMTDDYKLTSIGGGKLSISGSLDLKMTDFKVEPPVMMFGTLKTGDDIQIKYDLVFQKS